MNRTDMILTLFLDKTPIVGATRLQKLIFLVEKEGGEAVSTEQFEFEAYKFGPFSKQLKDDMDFLINLGFLEKSNDEKINPITITDDNIDTITAKDILSDKSDSTKRYAVGEDFEQETNLLNPDDYKAINDLYAEDWEDNVVFKITKKGIEHLDGHNMKNDEGVKTITKIKKKYGNLPLFNLLQYVYSKYPDYATESEIKDKIK